jgi:hypothetical protein
MTTVDATAQPSCFRNASFYPTLCFLPFSRNTLGPLCPAATPVRYIVMEPLQSKTFFSCFFFPFSPIILSSPLASAIKFISLPPRMKWLMSLPNDFPVALHTPVFFVHKQSAFSYNLNHQNCCAKVHWLCFCCSLLSLDRLLLQLANMLFDEGFVMVVVSLLMTQFWMEGHYILNDGLRRKITICTICPDGMFHEELYILFGYNRWFTSMAPKFMTLSWAVTDVLLEGARIDFVCSCKCCLRGCTGHIFDQEPLIDSFHHVGFISSMVGSFGGGEVPKLPQLMNWTKKLWMALLS